MPINSTTPFRKGNIEHTEPADLEQRRPPLTANSKSDDGFEAQVNNGWLGFSNGPRKDPVSGAGWAKEAQDEFHYFQRLRNGLNSNGITTVSATGELPVLTSSEQLKLVRQLIVDSDKPLYFLVLVDDEVKSYSDKAEWLKAVSDQVRGTLPPSVIGAKSDKEGQLALIDESLAPKRTI